MGWTQSSGGLSFLTQEDVPRTGAKYSLDLKPELAWN